MKHCFTWCIDEVTAIQSASMIFVDPSRLGMPGTLISTPKVDWDSLPMTKINSQSSMREVLEVFPGAQRALFRRYHIGGCSSCVAGFLPNMCQPDQ
ncbi:MAG: hypothetical protein WBS33_00820 [Verrucomicrobiia bacterium]